MITCDSCGKPNPADMSNCQYCRAPLTGQSRGKANAQQQIPAWLESLKASERPTPPANSQDSFSVADLVDSNALPGWMRPDSAALAGNGDSNKYPALRPAGIAGPNTDSSGSGVTPGSLSASSLIDSASLPSWMRPAPAAQPDAISASSLVEPESLPGWLTAQASMPQAPQAAQAAQPPHPSQSLQSPQTWQAVQQPAFQQPAPPAQMSPTSQMSQSTWQGPSNLQGGDARPDSGIAGSSLLDMQALPQWLREEGQSSQQSTGQGTGLSASSLIDMDGLPDWLRTAGQVPQSGYGTPSSTGAFGGSGVYGTPAGNGTPPRVPSRPRPEMAPPEQSEVAANVLSSMLGVASISPSYPASPTPVTQQPFQAAPPQAAGQSPRFPSPAGNPYAQPGMQSSSQQMGYPGTANGPAPAWPQGQFQETRPGWTTETTGTKTARRGFLETIRGWFHL